MQDSGQNFGSTSGTNHLDNHLEERPADEPDLHRDLTALNPSADQGEGSAEEERAELDVTGPGFDLHTFKTAFLQRHTQFILFDSKGLILDSCNTLLDLEGVETSVFDLFPILGDARDILASLRRGDKDLVYPALELALGNPDRGASDPNEERVLDIRLKALDGQGAWRGLLVMHDNTEVYDAIMRLRKRTQKAAREQVLKVVR